MADIAFTLWQTGIETGCHTHMNRGEGSGTQTTNLSVTRHPALPPVPPRYYFEEAIVLDITYAAILLETVQ